MATRTFPVYPLDLNRLLRPKTITQFIDVPGTNPADALMVEMPQHLALDTWGALVDLAQRENRSIAVILLDDNRPGQSNPEQQA